MSDATTKSTEWPNYQAWVFLGVLVASHATTNVLLSPFGGPEIFPRMVAIGVIFSQPVLFATWAVLGPRPLTKRLPLTLAALAVCVFAATPRNVQGPQPVYFILTLALFAVWSIVTLVAAKLTGWKITNINNTAETGVTVNQFSLKYLLALTTVCAIVLGLGRWLAPRQNWGLSVISALHFVDDILQPIGFVTLAMLPSIFLPLLVVAVRRPFWVFVIILLAWLPLTWLAVEAIVATATPQRWWDIAESVVALQISAAIAGLISAVVLRFCGYRLVSRRSATRQPSIVG